MKNNDFKKIISATNDFIKYCVRLKEGKFQKKEGKFLVEGENIVKDGIKKKIVDTILVTEKKINLFSEFTNVILISDNISKKLSDVNTNQEIFAIFNYKEKEINYNKNILVLDSIQDPGNLGTLIRSACAFNFESIILSSTSVNCFNSKVIRSSQGYVFDVAIKYCDLHYEIKKLKQKKYNIYMTDLHSNSKNYKNIKVDGKNCLVLGNEGQGISKDLLTLEHNNILILTQNNVESLNVGVAGSIIMSHFFK